jgi:calcineurin-like phosphoesterase family protein
MNEVLIANWNRVVSNEDTVYVVGDFGFGDMSGINSRLNGIIHLIKGNHDKPITSRTFNFASVQKYLVLQIEHLKILLIHNPVYQDTYKSGLPPVDYDICLYGHVHDREQGWIEKDKKWYRNCSVEVMNYTPQLLSDVMFDCPGLGA